MRRTNIVRIAGLLLLASCVAPVDTDQSIGPLSMSVVSGNNQSAPAGTELPNPIVARVEDSRGRPVKGQVVNFRVVSGGGSVFAGVSITGMDGIAQERWTIGAVGPQRVEARAVDNATGAKLTFAMFDATVLDVQAPQVLNVSTVPSPVAVGVAFDLTALISDASTGGSNIVAASFTLDGGAANAMVAQDGAFNSPTEAVRAAIPAFPSGGSHLFCVTGRDAQNNVSGASCLSVVIAEDAVYVSTTGNDVTGTGSPLTPLRTITAGLTLAASLAKLRVNVAAGSYPENIQLRNSVSLYGGYDPSTWSRAPGTSVTVIGPGPSTTAIAVEGNGVTGVTIDGFTIRSGDAPLETESAYGFLVVNSTLTISNNHIIAGNGGPGPNAADGSPVPNGAVGSPGNPGGLSQLPGAGGLGGFTPCGLSGGNGGRGGDPGLTGARGDPGANVNSGSGGAGGVGGAEGPLPAGQNGFDGFPGSNGQPGLGGVDFTGVGFNGFIYRYGPADGNSGFGGLHGGSGGGGGGGGGLTFTASGGGNGGGGGGSGGCGGSGGQGGFGGGASLAIVGLLSTLTVTGNTIETGHGGVGGNGGNGTPGGTGAAGGLGATADPQFVGAGGNGGRGGNGGTGGPGGGGGGGASIGILGQAVRLTESGNTFVLGNGGVGGLAPPGGNPGANGRRVAVQSPP